MYKRFGLTLMMTHECNLRCRYCYAGEKFSRQLPLEMGYKAIDRSIASIQNKGRLELGFFGGEPLLESERISNLIEYARNKTDAADIKLIPTLTTNGTIRNPQAWSLMTLPELKLAVSMDGMPENHDRYRRFADGRGSSKSVLETLDKLLKNGKTFKVICVVGPENLESVADNVRYLRELGIPQIDLSLDLWSRWDSDSLAKLEQAVIQCAKLWVEGLPNDHLSWFDDKAAMLAQYPEIDRCRCGFGKGDIAVTPAGNLYPCERLINGDTESNPMRLPGNVMTGENFLFGDASNTRTAEQCKECGIEAVCNTTCGCCNQVRTGSPGRPDGLLCMFNQWCLRETQAILEKIVLKP